MPAVLPDSIATPLEFTGTVPITKVVVRKVTVPGGNPLVPIALNATFAVRVIFSGGTM
jgi:hypothetical protein